MLAHLQAVSFFQHLPNFPPTVLEVVVRAFQARLVTQRYSREEKLHDTPSVGSGTWSQVCSPAFVLLGAAIKLTDRECSRQKGGWLQTPAGAVAPSCALEHHIQLLNSPAGA